MFRKICLLSLPSFIVFASVLIGFRVVHAGPLDALLDPRISSWARDAGGNRHYIWVAEDGAATRLYYRMIGPTGLTVVDSLLVDQVHAKVRRPQILVDHRRQIHLLWQERPLAPNRIQANNEIHYARFKLSPAAPSLQTLYHRLLSAQGDLGAKHPRMALNRRDEVAVVWEDPKTGILLTKLDPTGRGVVPTIIVPGPFQAPVQPTIAADSLGRLHVAWVNRSSEQAKTSRILYTVASGDRLKPLIRPTTLYRLAQPLKSVSIGMVDGKHLEVGWSIERTEGVYSSMGPDGSVSFDLIRKDTSSHSSWAVLVRDIRETQLTRTEKNHPKLVVEGMILRDPALKNPLAPVPASLIHVPSVRKRFIPIGQTQHSNENLRFNLWALAPPEASYSI